MNLDLKNIEETPHLLSLLLECEDVIDSLDVYVFKNWIDGEVVSGPNVKRYWVSITLKYDYDRMPDPKGALRLLKHGILVKYTKRKQEDAYKTTKEHEASINVWLVTIEIPRKLLQGMNDGETDYYDDDVNMQDVESAKDLGVDEETPYTE